MVRWGMIGAGDVTEVKSSPAFNKVADSKLLMVMRRNPDKLRDYAERHQVPHYTTNADDVFNNPGIDAVYIATPPASHAGYTIRAANAGKHVYVEKPMAASIRQRIALRHHLPLRGVFSEPASGVSARLPANGSTGRGSRVVRANWYFPPSPGSR